MSEYRIKLEQFEGPLDLLLKLIEKEELDISKVSLARVTEQYIEYVGGLSPPRGSPEGRESELNPDELADFLVVATRLLLIKSKSLLPQIDLEGEDSAEELERQLKMYKAFLEATRRIESIILEKRFGFSREKLPKNLNGIFTPPKNVDGNVLARVLREIINSLEILPKLKEAGIKRVVSIREKMRDILGLIMRKAETGFDEVIHSACDRLDVIVCFLAVLELVKQRKVAVVQKDGFGEIKIERVIE